MDPDVAECAKCSVQEYNQRNSSMVGNMIYQGGKYGRGHKSSTTKCYMFSERRSELSQ